MFIILVSIVALLQKELSSFSKHLFQSCSGKSGPALAGTENRLVVWTFRLVICPGRPRWLTNTNALGSMVLWIWWTTRPGGTLIPYYGIRVPPGLVVHHVMLFELLDSGWPPPAQLGKVRECNIGQEKVKQITKSQGNRDLPVVCYCSCDSHKINIVCIMWCDCIVLWVLCGYRAGSRNECKRCWSRCSAASQVDLPRADVTSFR